VKVIFFFSPFLFLFPSFETDSSPLLQLPLHRSLASLFPHHLLLLRSHPKQLSRSLLETSLAMSSPSDSKPALGDGEQQPHLPLDAPPSLPAPPPPPACSVPTSSSASATASFFNPWPFNDPSVLLFLDPFSPEAQELKKTLEVSSTLSSPPSSLPSPPSLSSPVPSFSDNSPHFFLQITSLAFGHTFPSTLLAVEASHIVLDPSYSDANVFFRHGFPQKCVSMMWLRESFIKASPRAEEEYRLPSVDDVEEESTS